METATAVAEQTQVLRAIATSQADYSRIMATQTAVDHVTVSADALQLAQIIGPGLSPFTPLFFFLVVYILWRPFWMMLKRFGIVPPAR